MGTILLDGTTGGSADGVGEHGTALWQHRLLGIIFRHLLTALLLKVTADFCQNILVQNQLSTKCLRNRLLGQVVVGGAEATCGDDNIGTLSGNLQSFLESLGIIAHNGVVVYSDTEGRQPLGEHLCVGVGDVAQQQLRTDSNQFNGM